MRRGAILLFSLIVMAITVIVTSSLSLYYVNTARMARFYEHRRSERRVGASKVIGSAVQMIEKLVVPENVRGLGMDEVLDKVVEAVNKAVGKNAGNAAINTKVNGETYQLSAQRVEGKNAVKITASYSGAAVASATVEFDSAGDELNTLEVFNYVYFADNNGQLNSSYIIANGDVGSNGNFDLRGATINGYVCYLNNLTLNSAHAWLQGAYMGKVAAEFMFSSSDQATIEQARPTNPVLTVDGAGRKVSKDWEGGYGAVYATNPYEIVDPQPTEVPPPGDEPQLPKESDIRREGPYK